MKMTSASICRLGLSACQNGGRRQFTHGGRRRFTYSNAVDVSMERKYKSRHARVSGLNTSSPIKWLQNCARTRTDCELQSQSSDSRCPRRSRRLTRAFSKDAEMTSIHYSLHPELFLQRNNLETTTSASICKLGGLSDCQNGGRRQIHVFPQAD
jgi:hypothetical protein